MDRFADLRAALTAGVTPGPWFADERGNIWRRDPKELYENGGGVAGDRPVATANVGWYGEGAVGFPAEANGRLIAAAHPETISALLAERDALRDALWVATEHNALHFGESHNTVIQGRAALAQEQGGSDAE